MSLWNVDPGVLEGLFSPASGGCAAICTEVVVKARIRKDKEELFLGRCCDLAPWTEKD